MAVAEVPDVNHRAPSSDLPPPQRQPAIAFSPRIIAVAVVLAIECLVYARCPDHRLSVHLPIAAFILFCVTLCFFARPQLRAAHLDDAPINRRFILFHVLAVAFVAAETLSFTHFFPPTQYQPLSPLVLAFRPIWTASVIAAVLVLAAALLPLRRFFNALRASSWIFAALLTLSIIAVRALFNSAWNATNSRLALALQTATFDGVQGLLNRFYPDIISIPALKVIGTPHFKIMVAGSCSGIEGLALMLVFTTGWIIYTRRELRLGRALLLVPIALAISWLLNLVRIAALIALGNAGYARIALNGFHSQAGWILFNAIALTFLLTAEHLPWVRRNPPPTHPLQGKDLQPSSDLYDRNLAAPYLVPFLAVLATSLLTRAVSSGFDALYPLRFVVALIALVYYRADHRRLYQQSQWRFGWLGPLAGIVIFAFWLPLAHLNGLVPGSSPLPYQLAQLPSSERIAWITIRALAAVLTVPVAEELAFRGYLARRIQSPDVDTIPFANLTLLSILISSVAFGALHGSMWIAGILSGLIFALVAKFRNRLGEAIAAHATANLLIVIWVLTRHDYSLW